VGYFFTEELELSGDLWYHFYWRTAYTRQESAGQVYQSDYHWLNHDLSIRIAIRYNLHVSRALVPFVGVSSGVKWAKYGSSQSDNRVEYSNWTSPSYLVPSALLGSRFFVADNWAVLLQLDYRGFGKDERSDDVRARSYAVTIGLVTFL
jgi:opacity protein-like surface antigen